MGAVRLIYQNQNAVVLVQHLKLVVGFINGFRFFHPGFCRRRQIVCCQRLITGAIRVTVFLDGGKNQPRPLALCQSFHAVGALGHLHHFAGQRGGDGQLPLQVLAVGDNDDLEAPQVSVCAHLAHQEHHGERLA
ncbi:hypothetical protein D3C80_1523560 [compost metagenome]